MSTHSASPIYPVPVRRLSSAWLYARPLWAGLSIISMWLAVLFVGVFGGNIVSATAAGGSSSVPVVVVVAGLALIASWILGRLGFAATPESDELRRLLEEERLARESLEAEIEELRLKLLAEAH
ncbi:MAG: hypothetical protein ACXVUE_07320 [Solirubrobacteraceae bacterium]